MSALNRGEGRRHRFAAELLARSARPYDPDSLEAFQQYAGICPFVYDRFVASYTG